METKAFYSHINRALFSGYALGCVVGFAVGVFVCSIAFAQTAILTPGGAATCGAVGSMTFCNGPGTGNTPVTIMPLGNETYAVTPWPTPSYPTLEEPNERRESSTPLFLSPSEAKPERRFEAESTRIPCYSLYRDC